MNMPSVPKIGPVSAPDLERQRLRKGTRNYRVCQLIAESGWKPHQVIRGLLLSVAEEAPATRRRRHHGSRDDLVSYVLCSRPGVPTVVVATVGSQHDPAKALPRAIRQAQRLDVPLACATNGVEVVEHFAASGRTQHQAGFTFPHRAWRAWVRYHQVRGPGADLLGQSFDFQRLADAVPCFPYVPSPVLRYYQVVALNRALVSGVGRWLAAGGVFSGEGSELEPEDECRLARQSWWPREAPDQINEEGIPSVLPVRPPVQALLQLAPGSGTTVTAWAILAKLMAYQLGRRTERPLRLVYLDDRFTGAPVEHFWGGNNGVKLYYGALTPGLGPGTVPSRGVGVVPGPGTVSGRGVGVVPGRGVGLEAGVVPGSEGETVPGLGMRPASTGFSEADVVVLNLAHGGVVPNHLPAAFQLALVGSDQTAAVLAPRFGRPLYRYPVERAQAEGFWTAPI
jgi:hypothetical protein